MHYLRRTVNNRKLARGFENGTDRDESPFPAAFASFPNFQPTISISRCVMARQRGIIAIKDSESSAFSHYRGE